MTTEHTPPTHHMIRVILAGLGLAAIMAATAFALSQTLFAHPASAAARDSADRRSALAHRVVGHAPSGAALRLKHWKPPRLKPAAPPRIVTITVSAPAASTPAPAPAPATPTTSNDDGNAHDE
jgi:hypothetical protein